MSSSIDNNNNQKLYKLNNLFRLSVEKQKVNLFKNQHNKSLLNKLNYTCLNSNKNNFYKKITRHFVYKNPSNSLIIQNNFKPLSKINNIKLQNYRKNSAELNNCGYDEHNNINLIFNNFNLSSKNIDSKKNNYDNIPNNNSINTFTMYLTNKNIKNNNEYKKIFEQLNLLYKEKTEENKNIKNKMIETKKENLKLRKTIFKLEQENKKFIKTFGAMQKLIAILQNSGIDVEGLIDNISSNRENIESSEITKNEYNKENVLDTNESITNDNFKCYETFKESKLVVKEKNIPKLNIKKIINRNNNNNNDNNNNQVNNQKKFEEFKLNKDKKNRNKLTTHSVEK